MPALQLCTMCDQYYSDPLRHKVMDCYYYVGCPCGLKPTNKKHVEGCFMARERARKDKTRSRFPQPPPMLRNADLKDEIVCCYCFRDYYSSKEEHEEKYCPYFIGCYVCGQKKVDKVHVETCKKRKENAVPDEIQLVCRYCRQNVPMSQYDEHMKLQCGPKTIDGIIEETAKVPRLSLLPPRPLDMVPCGLCGSDIMKVYIESHSARCKDTVKSKFSSTVYYASEPRIVDLRRTASTKDLREVIFEEGP